MQNLVLIVEDHAATRETLSLLFETRGFIARGAACIAEATELFDTECPSVALVDIGLPDGNGLDLIEAWAQRNPAVPVIVVTASDERLAGRDAIKRGACAFIKKPYAFADLLSAVNKALNHADP